MTRVFRFVRPIIDINISPFVLVAVIVLRVVAALGLRQQFFSNSIFNLLGIYPLRDHYYEPLINAKHLHKPMSEERELPGIKWNVAQQLDLLESFHFQDELAMVPSEHVSETAFHYNNGSFEQGAPSFCIA